MFSCLICFKYLFHMKKVFLCDITSSFRATRVVTTSHIAPPTIINQSEPKEAGGSIKECFNSRSSAHSWLDFPACISELYETVLVG